MFSKFGANVVRRELRRGDEEILGVNTKRLEVRCREVIPVLAPVCSEYCFNIH